MQNLRNKYPKFVYKDYSYKISGKKLEIFFDFEINSRKIENNISFRPKITISPLERLDLSGHKKRGLENLIFHLGLIEMVSYWKTTCSPEIEIQAGSLNQKQIKWWKNFILKGMGQFFYENRINWQKKDFLKITATSEKKHEKNNEKLKNRYLVPFAGGRDSIVTLESLKRSASRQKEIVLFMVNPTRRIIKTAKVSGIKKQIIVKRIIDKKLLELNKKGYLNGHTPFTALLSFISVFAAVLFDYKNIAFSNEKSANEGNLKYLGKTINHQWAKSSEFEKMFRNYVKKFLAKEINYFSYLREYNELEASKMLIKYPKYFPVFSSCNASMKITGPPSPRLRRVKWCGKCPKCLFVYATFYPFLDKKDLLKIFGKDIFDPSTSLEQEKLLSIMKSLIKEGIPKPFECVGTKKESRTAFKLSLEKAKLKENKIPHLLTKFSELL